MQILHVLDDVHYSISIDEIIYKFSVDKIILPEINQFENNFYKDRRVKYTTRDHIPFPCSSTCYQYSGILN